MKKTIVTIILLNVLAGVFAQSKYLNRVLEFLPAPGQFTNEGGYPPYTAGADAALMAERATAIMVKNTASTADNMSTISLGAYGGYIIVGFDHSIYNRPYSYDFKIHGNSFTDWSETGIVMVSKDVNGNGLADDPWYEIAGSDYHNPATTHNYEIRYYRPDPLNANVKWTDNQGNTGYVLRNTYHNQASYYPMWFEEDTLIFRGTKLTHNIYNTAVPPQQYWVAQPYGWGYADNQSNTSELTNFDIDWAVDANGNPVILDKIDFIKVYTGIIADGGWLGEVSTEFSQAEDLHPNYSFPPTFASSVHVVKNLPTASHQDSISDGFVYAKATWTDQTLTNGYTLSSEAGTFSSGFTSVSGLDFDNSNSTYMIGVYDKTTTNMTIWNNDKLSHGPEGVYVNNTLQNIEFFKSAGLVSGDYVNLVAKGVKADGTYTGTSATFRLADYTFLNAVMHHTVSKWVWMDLSAIGSAAGIEFTLAAKRAAILPQSFCLSNLTIDIIPISKQPLAANLCEGSPYVLSAIYDKNDLIYQWYKDKETVVGANNYSLIFDAVSANDAGSYYCIASDGKNSTQSNTVLLSVNTPLSNVLDLPDTVLVNLGDTIVLAPKVAGNITFFRWNKNGTMLMTTQNATAWSKDLVLNSFGLADQAKYEMRIKGSCGTTSQEVYCKTVYLKLNYDTSIDTFFISKQPVNDTVIMGQNAEFKIETSIPPTYQWQTPNATGTYQGIQGSIDNSYLKSKLIIAPAYAKNIRCAVSSNGKTLISDTVNVVTVQNLQFTSPAVMEYGGYSTQTIGKVLKMAVKALDFTPTAFQWYYRSAANGTWTKLIGETDSVYTLGSYLTAADAGQYRCDADGPRGVSTIVYTLKTQAAISTAPSIQAYTGNAGTTVTARATGIFTAGENAVIRAAVLTGYDFKWYKDGQEIIIPDENKNLANDATLTSGYWLKSTGVYLFMKKIQPEMAGEYVLEAIEPGTGFVVKSSKYYIVVNPQAPEVTVALKDTVMNEDDTLTLTAHADLKDLTATYQWYFNGTIITGGTKSPFITTGPDKQTYSLVVKPKMTGTYFFIVTTAGGKDTSNVMTLSIKAKVPIAAHPTDQIVFAGQTATFSITAEGTNLKYQWLKDGKTIDGATAATLTVANATSSNEGVYACQVRSDNALTVTSGDARLVVAAKPVISGNKVCDATTAILRVQTQVKEVLLRYQWYKDDVLISGATSTWITIADATNDKSSYQCKITNGAFNTMGSESVVLLKPTISNVSVTHCGDYTANGETFTSSGIYTQHILNKAGCDSTITLNLTILKPTTSVITETVCESYTVNGETFTETGTYTQKLTNKAGCDSTITLELRIGNIQRDTVPVSVQDSYIWNGTEYLTSGIYSYTAQSQYGCDSIALIDLTILKTQKIHLSKGWNLFSFAVQPADTEIATILGEAITSIAEIKTASSFYNASQNPILNTLVSLEPGVGYMILADTETELEISGKVKVLKQQPALKTGWNLVGCQTLEPQSLQEAFPGLFDRIYTIKDFGASQSVDHTNRDGIRIEPTKAYLIEIR